MIRTIFLFLLTFFTVLAVANNAPDATPPPDVHVQDAYGAIAFLAGVVVAVLGFLLKFFMTRDRSAIDDRISAMQKALEDRMTRDTFTMGERVNDVHRHLEDRAKENRSYIDGVGVKLERLADTVEEKIGQSLDELRRHDADLYEKYNELNRTFGKLLGEHDTLHNHKGRRE